MIGARIGEFRARFLALKQTKADEVIEKKLSSQGLKEDLPKSKIDEEMYLSPNSNFSPFESKSGKGFDQDNQKWQVKAKPLFSVLDGILDFQAGSYSQSPTPKKHPPSKPRPKRPDVIAKMNA